MAMNKKERLEKLYAFISLDKYATFCKAQSGIIHAHEDQQQIISELLDNCCKDLAIEIESAKKPQIQCTSYKVPKKISYDLLRQNTEKGSFIIKTIFFLTFSIFSAEDFRKVERFFDQFP